LFDPAHTPDGHVLMQSTGLTDRNGVEIFEGDMVEDTEAQRGAVRWDQPSAMMMITFEGGLDEPLTGWPDRVCPRPHTDDLNVIGNVHQDPELLETE
jgi:hypothetical protein